MKKTSRQQSLLVAPPSREDDIVFRESQCACPVDIVAMGNLLPNGYPIMPSGSVLEV
jgi:hypothetical protein